MGKPLEELSPRTRWLGQRVEFFRSVDSTNRVAEELADEGAPEGTLVLADAQTAGRGRLGRSFFSPAGRSVYLSVLLRPTVEPDAVHHNVFAAALAVAETVRSHIPAEREVAIKWPNDVQIDGRKVSGINLPVQLDGGGVRSAILGVGVNVNVAEEEFPPELQPIATSVRIARGGPTDRVAFAEALIERLEEELDRLREQGFRPLLDAWGKFFRMRGARVRVSGPGVAREIDGIVEGVDPEGALLLRTDRGVERVLAGDVTLVKGRG
jgi:BirA family biotin operon repressor/biotin-[acetyl-CoA-carboxylase] ligase